MDYEKAYKEALERAKEKRDEYERLDGEKSFVPSDIEYIFPELRENEDELMRKEAIAIIKQYNIICEREGDKCYTADKVISWLEKQGEQKSAWNKEDNKNLNSVEWIIENSENLNEVFETIDSPEYIKKYFIDWLKSLKYRFQPKPKQEWSEEDERMLGKCIDAASGYYSPEDKQSIKDWLESLKDRVQPQPKQELSEEDEKIILSLHHALNCTDAQNAVTKTVVEVADVAQWLSDCKERFAKPNHWKPSKEQMNALDKAKNSPANYHDIRLGLQSLYNDLLKL